MVPKSDSGPLTFVVGVSSCPLANQVRSASDALSVFPYTGTLARIASSYPPIPIPIPLLGPRLHPRSGWSQSGDGLLSRTQYRNWTAPSKVRTYVLVSHHYNTDLQSGRPIKTASRGPVSGIRSLASYRSRKMAYGPHAGFVRLFSPSVRSGRLVDGYVLCAYSRNGAKHTS